MDELLMSCVLDACDVVELARSVDVARFDVASDVDETVGLESSGPWFVWRKHVLKGNHVALL